MKQSMREYRNSINRGTVEVVLQSHADIAVLCNAIRFRRFFFLHCGMEESDLYPYTFVTDNFIVRRYMRIMSQHVFVFFC